MGTGYVRNDTANSIANGNVIDADVLDGEFNAVESAFNAATGHNHDGSAANGAPITKLGPTQDVVASATILYPKTTNTVSLGTASLKFKDAYFDGIVYTDDITLNGTAITATAAELNALDGITATVTELNYTDGVTSNIQTQLDGKQPLDADLTAIGALAKTDGNIIVGDGTTWVTESGATARASLGVSIGSQVQAWDANLDQLAALTPSDNYFVVGNGTAWTAETPAAALASLGVTTTAAELNYVDGVTSNVQTQLNNKQALDATLTALAAFNTNGILTQTAADTFTGRTIGGTTNQISVTNGDGVAGNPVIAAVVASQAEAEAGTDATKLMTPQRVAQAIATGVKSNLNASGSAPIYACRAWVVFDGTGTVSITGAGNVSSITDHGTGMYTINFTTTLPTAAYAAVINCGQDYVDYDGQYIDSVKIRSRTSTSLRIDTVNDSSTTSSRTDMLYINVAIFC